MVPTVTIRTDDIRFTGAALCQLSYAGDNEMSRGRQPSLFRPKKGRTEAIVAY